MRLNGGPDAMDSWPLDWKLGSSELAHALLRLKTYGFRAWPGGQMLAPNPFGHGFHRCRLEVWKPGLALRFFDGLSPCVIPQGVWEGWQAAGTQEIADFLLSASHPLRFSPYAYLGEENRLFTGREEEIKLLLSPIPGVILCGQAGMGKSLLLKAAATKARTRVISAEASGAKEMRRELAASIREMTSIVFLDEMDSLLREDSIREALLSLNRAGVAWRAVSHRPVPGLGVHLLLQPPKGMEQLLDPLKKISGKALETRVERLVLKGARGNPRRLQRLCCLILKLMGSRPAPVTLTLAGQALYRLAAVEGTEGGYEGNPTAAGIGLY